MYHNYISKNKNGSRKKELKTEYVFSVGGTKK